MCVCVHACLSVERGRKFAAGSPWLLLMKAVTVLLSVI